MIQRKIQFKLVPDITKFINAASRCDFDIDLVSGRYVIDGKSIMGIWSMDLAKAIELDIHADEGEAAAFLDDIKDMLV